MWDETTRQSGWPGGTPTARPIAAERFTRDLKKCKVVELHNTTHAGFVFEADQQKILLREMRAFLGTGR